MKAAWSEVDVQLERRADLIPNLVATVKGFTKEESSVFADIAQAREGLMNAQTPQDKIAANNQLDASLAKVLVLTENYPQLRSSDQFMRLQDELSGTENRISVARKRYNDSHPGLQHVHSAVPQQHLGGDCRLPPEQRLLRSQPGSAKRAQREFLKPSPPLDSAGKPNEKGHSARAGWPFRFGDSLAT